MNRKILFTPVGGTDPISQWNMYEGAMLHISRYYKPDKVIMYMSKEIMEIEKEDHRYTYCLEELGKLQNRKIEYEIINRESLNKVYDFNYFYKDFKNIIEDIVSKLDESDELLLNVSSGTPAMKSGLIVLKTMLEYPLKLIQVLTPSKSMNEHQHKDYDVKLLWELNADNLEEAENRCIEIECPALVRIKKEEIIKEQILNYNYVAALDIAKGLNHEVTKDYIDLIELAVRRKQLDIRKISKIEDSIGIKILPIRSGDSCKYFEYALNLQLRLKKHEYADFIRAITPILVDLFERVLLKQCNVDIDDYTYIDKNTKSRKWDINRKMQGSKILEILNEKYNSFRGGNIYSDHLREIIIAMSDNVRLKEIVDDLRNIEIDIRNIAAHEIVSINREVIEERIKTSPEKIMELIRQLFTYTDINVKKEYWDSYDDMNNIILERIY